MAKHAADDYKCLVGGERTHMPPSLPFVTRPHQLAEASNRVQEMGLRLPEDPVPLREGCSRDDPQSPDRGPTRSRSPFVSPPTELHSRGARSCIRSKTLSNEQHDDIDVTVTAQGRGWWAAPAPSARSTNTVRQDAGRWLMTRDAREYTVLGEPSEELDHGDRSHTR
jgi:hypothetical protein